MCGRLVRRADGREHALHLLRAEHGSGGLSLTSGSSANQRAASCHVSLGGGGTERSRRPNRMGGFASLLRTCARSSRPAVSPAHRSAPACAMSSDRTAARHAAGRALADQRAQAVLRSSSTPAHTTPAESHRRAIRRREPMPWHRWPLSWLAVAAERPSQPPA